MDYYNNAYTDTLDTLNSFTKNTALLHLMPTIRSSGDKYTFVIGLNAYLESGVVDEPSNLFPFPSVEFSYNIIDNYLIPYIGINSEVVRNTFKKLTDENPFLISSIELKNTAHKIRLYGGMKGALS